MYFIDVLCILSIINFVNLKTHPTFDSLNNLLTKIIFSGEKKVMKTITFINKKKILLFSFLLIVSFGYSQSSPATYTTSGNTFAVPAGVTSITVEAWGGGDDCE